MNTLEIQPFNVTLKGLRIPWVAAWELEKPSIKFDTRIQMAACFTGGFNHAEDALSGSLGKVILGEMAPQRQRLAVLKNLCQVCAQDLSVTRVMLGTAAPRGADNLISYDEPPCCPSCALIAIQQCPHASAMYVEIGAIIATDLKQFISQFELSKDDNRHSLVKGGVSLHRTEFRRYRGRKLAMHIRTIPTSGVNIQGSSGIDILTKLANKPVVA